MQACSSYTNCSYESHEIYSKDDNLIFMKCNECGLIWRSKQSLHVVKAYDKNYFNSKNYLKNRAHKIKKSEGLLHLAMQFHPGIHSLLEVGCSVGNTLQAAKNLGINHLGIDISSFAVNFCKQMNLNAKRLNLEQLLNQKEKFDLIFMQHVLEHFESPIEMLNHCNQLLNQNGLILILVPNARYFKAHKKREKHRFYSKMGVGAEHFVYFNYDTLTEILESTGFKILQKNYPVMVRNSNSPMQLLNRIVRKTLSVIKFDQEIIVVAQKTV